MSSGGIDNRHLFRGMTPTHSFPGSVDQDKGSDVGKMEGRGVTKNDSHNLEVPKQKGVDAPKGGRFAEIRKGGDDGGMKSQAKLSGVPDRAGMIKFAGRPKSDIKFLGITIHKMSTGYKAVLGELDQYKNVTNNAYGQIGKAGIDHALDMLNDVDKAAAKYEMGAKHGRTAEMGELRQQIQAEKQLLLGLRAEIDALPGSHLPMGMSIGDALAYAKQGCTLDQAVRLNNLMISPDKAGEHLQALNQQSPNVDSPKVDNPKGRSLGTGNNSIVANSDVGSFKFDPTIFDNPFDSPPKVDSPKVDSPKVGSPQVGSAKVDMFNDIDAYLPYFDKGLSQKEAQVLHDHGHGPEIGELYQNVNVPINEQTVARDLIDANRKGVAEKLGQGAFNVVYKLEFEREDKTSSTGAKTTFTGVFKKEVNHQDAVGWSGQMMGISMSNPQLGCRNIAARNTNDLLHWDVVPKVEFGIYNNQLGIVMEMAPGKTRWTDKEIELTGQEALDLKVAKQMATMGMMGVSFQQQIDDAGKRMGGEIKFVGDKVILHKLQNEIDYDNGGVQKGLVQLQWLDGIDAQGDRHGGNYLVGVDKNGKPKVTGIDNDQAEGRLIKDANQCKYSNDAQHKGYRSCGWPPIADESMYRDVMALTEQGIRDAHEGILTPLEIDAKVERMKAAQNHMTYLLNNNGIIKDDAWGTPQVTDYLKQGDDNYVGRDYKGIV